MKRRKMSILKDISDRVTKDGSSGFNAEKGRYHLYIAKSCPFAQRARLARVLKGLQDTITVDVVDVVKIDSEGWKFAPEKEGCTPDTINGKTFLKEVYLMSHPEYKGTISVPVLFDKLTNKIVCNDSSDIARMLNSEFNEFCSTKEQAALDLYPKEKRKEIDDLNSWILPNISLGVYGTVFCKTQDAYEEKVNKVFDALDRAEALLANQRFLAGSELTEADIKLFVALVRFDSVYYPLFKCNKKQIRDYPNLWKYTCDIYGIGDVASTVNIPEIRAGYWTSTYFTAYHGIVPIGPDIDFTNKDAKK